MSTLLQLAERLEKKAKKIDEAASDLAAFVALELTAELADVTPVDTSKAISNWRIGLVAPVADTIEPHYFGSKGSTESMSEDATVIAAKVALKAKKPGQKIYLSNTADYIVELDQGSSLQAPAGFVHRACENTRALAKRQRLELK